MTWNYVKNQKNGHNSPNNGPFPTFFASIQSS